MASKGGSRKTQAEVEWAQAQAPQFQRVSWTREPHLRKLYAMSIALMIASATTGYDGMLVNTSQQIELWNEFFGKDIDDDNKLGILINMFNLGSITSFFITPHIADTYGRRIAIILGCVFMVTGGCLTAFCNGYGSMSYPSSCYFSQTSTNFLPTVFIGGRFMLGFGNSLAQMASPLLLTEICHPQHRGPVTAIYNCLWNLGALRK